MAVWNLQILLFSSSEQNSRRISCFGCFDTRHRCFPGTDYARLSCHAHNKSIGSLSASMSPVLHIAMELWL
ncbi:hypothetical protein QYM36_016750, partial [Artemia franciscana]